MINLRRHNPASLSLTALDFACIIIFQMPAEIEIDLELEPVVSENVTGKAFVATESAAYSKEKPKRPPGRNRKDGAPPGTVPSALAKDVPSPKYTSFYSDHDNAAQKTRAAWTWWKGLKPAQQDLLDAHVYRTWPVLLDPIDESEHKYIDKIIGAEPIQNDQDFIDRWGAGDYTLYLNVNPASGQRRTLFIAHVKCTHDFRKFTPTDRRIDNIANLSVTDPANAAYVAWLRSTGKIKNDAQITKEAEEMAAGSAVMAELVKDMAQDRRELTQKLLEKTEQQIVDPPPDPPSPKDVLTDQLAMFKSLKELVPSSDPMEMMRQVVATAQLLVQKDGNSDLKPLMDEIAKLREESRATEREFFRTQLADMKEQLRVVKETPPSSNVLLPDGSNLQSIVEKAVAKAVESGTADSDNSWWTDPLKALMPVAVPALIQGLGSFLRPAAPAAPFPMPPASYQAGAPMPPQQAQLPAPAQPQQAAPPQASGAYTTGIPQLDALLMQITVPLADALRDGDSGDTFAEFFITEYGFDIFTQLAGSGVDPIVNILYSYPPLTSTLKPLPREQVTRFISEFANFKPQAAPAGGAA